MEEEEEEEKSMSDPDFVSEEKFVLSDRYLPKETTSSIGIKIIPARQTDRLTDRQTDKLNVPRAGFYFYTKQLANSV